MRFNLFLFILIFAVTTYAKEVAVFPGLIDCPDTGRRGQVFQLIISGEYPNMCYYMGETYIDIQENNIFIKDTADVSEDPEDFCLLTNAQLKPYRKLLELTPDKSGEYTLHFMNTDGEYVPTKNITIH